MTHQGLFRKHQRNMHRRVARRLRQERGWRIKAVAETFGVCEATVLLWLAPYRFYFTATGVSRLGESIDRLTA